MRTNAKIGCHSKYEQAQSVINLYERERARKRKKEGERERQRKKERQKGREGKRVGRREGGLGEENMGCKECGVCRVKEWIKKGKKEVEGREKVRERDRETTEG